MAKTKWNILFATFVLSCLSLATLIVAFCTPYWVKSSISEIASIELCPIIVCASIIVS